MSPSLHSFIVKLLAAAVVVVVGADVAMVGADTVQSGTCAADVSLAVLFCVLVAANQQPAKLRLPHY